MPFGYIDSSSILKNNLRADTTLSDNITDLQTRVTDLETDNETLRNDVNTLQTQVTELINALNRFTAQNPNE